MLDGLSGRLYHFSSARVFHVFVVVNTIERDSINQIRRAIYFRLLPSMAANWWSCNNLDVITITWTLAKLLEAV